MHSDSTNNAKPFSTLVSGFCILFFAGFLPIGIPICIAQQKIIDSLNIAYENSKHDTTRASILVALSDELAAINIDTVIPLCIKAISIADKSIENANKFEKKSFLFAKANALNNIGYIQNLKGELNEAVDYYGKSLKIREEIGDKPGIAFSLSNIGLIHDQLGHTQESMDYLIRSLKIREEIGDKKDIAYSLNNLGYIYNHKGQIKEALKYYGRGLKIQEELGDKEGMTVSIINIGVIYSNLGQEKEALDYFNKSLKIQQEIGNKNGMATSYNNIAYTYESLGQTKEAIGFYNKSLTLYEETGDKHGVATSYNNIGVIHDHLGQKEEAKNYYLKSLKVREEIGDKQGIAYTLNNIGNFYFLQMNFEEASRYASLSLQTAKEIGNPKNIRNSERLLAKIDSARANAPLSGGYGTGLRLKFALSALDHYKQYIYFRDSIANEDNRKAGIRSQMQYEFEKREAIAKAEQQKKDVLAATEIRRQRLFFWLIVIVAIGTAAIAIIIFRSLKITRWQKHIIEIQKDEVTKQREEIAHKNKDLTDSINYAQRIQSAILTSEQCLNDMFLPKGLVSSHFILYKPKDIVAGDFYWAYKTPGDIAIWVAADSTGHGVPGAFMSMIGNSLLNEIVVEKGIHEPDEILNRMREGVIKALGQGGGDRKKDGLPSEINMKDGMDAAICCWNKSTNRISFSGANNSLWVIRKKSLSPLLPEGEGVLTHKTGSTDQVLPFGEDIGGVCEFTEILPDIQPVGRHLIMNPFTKKEFQLQPGDLLYTFTDGYCDQFGGPKGKKFKYKPFRELLISLQNKSMPEQREILDKTIEDWKGGMEQVDDICVFGVRV